MDAMPEVLVQIRWAQRGNLRISEDVKAIVLRASRGSIAANDGQVDVDAPTGLNNRRHLMDCGG